MPPTTTPPCLLALSVASCVSCAVVPSSLWCFKSLADDLHVSDKLVKFSPMLLFIEHIKSGPWFVRFHKRLTLYIHFRKYDCINTNQMDPPSDLGRGVASACAATNTACLRPWGSRRTHSSRSCSLLGCYYKHAHNRPCALQAVSLSCGRCHCQTCPVTGLANLLISHDIAFQRK